jgi:dTDP-L-rhamnose 4-epimerase
VHVLVTGGAGFIGSAIVDLLVAQGDEVTVVDRLHPGAHAVHPTRTNDAAAYRFEDLRDPDVARRAVEGVDAVCHQAAMVGLGVDFDDAPGYVGDNDLATAQLLRALHLRRFRGRIVLASSMVVYGEGRYRCPEHGVVRPGPRQAERLDRGDYEVRCPTCDGPLRPEPVTEDAPTDPRNVYAATKLHQEHLCTAYAREHDATVVALRYHNVYGPHMPAHTPYAGVASIFRSSLERGEPPRVFEDGGQTRDFVHVADVARANLAALVAPDQSLGSAVACNVASGTPRSVLDAAVAMASAVPGAPAPAVVGGYRLGDVRHVFASTERAADELGFRAAVGFAEGMAEFATAPLRMAIP